MDNFHKMIVMGITAVAGLTVLLFNFEMTMIIGLQEDVGVIREDVGYIKGVLNGRIITNLTNP